MMRRSKRGLAILLCACMIGGMTPLPVSAEGTTSEITLQTESPGDNLEDGKEKTPEISRTIIVTGFEEPDESVMYQQLAVGAKEEESTFPDELTVTVRIQTKSGSADGEADTDNAESTDAAEGAETSVELSGITWKFEEAESNVAVFDSSKDCNGYCYVYTPVLPETDADGNSIQVAEDAELPMFYVLIGEQQVMTLDAGNADADHYDKDGFCTGYELTNGTWKKRTGEAACTVEGCSGYQPAVLTTDQYDIDGNGSKDEVYEIGSAGQLYWFAGLVNGDTGVCTGGVTQNLSANAVLMTDITVNGSVLKTDGTFAGDPSSFRSWTPIGFLATDRGLSDSYCGKFDGQNHTVSGLYFSDYTGGVGPVCLALQEVMPEFPMWVL